MEIWPLAAGLHSRLLFYLILTITPGCGTSVEKQIHPKWREKKPAKGALRFVFNDSDITYNNSL